MELIPNNASCVQVLNVADLMEGVYTIQVKTDKTVCSKKALKKAGQPKICIISNIFFHQFSRTLKSVLY